MSFSNQIMKQPVKGKPHITLVGGVWRVSPRPWCQSNADGYRWGCAHIVAYELNLKRIMLRNNESDFNDWLYGKFVI